MPSQVDIYNLALARLGISLEVEDTAEKSKLARVLNRFYTISRDRVLRDFDWPFARRIEALALVTTQTVPGWSYVYEYPNNCAAVRAVTDSAGIRILSRTLVSEQSEAVFALPKFPFSVFMKGEEAGRLIACDVVEAYGVYTSKVQNTGLFDEGFVDTLAWRLASEAGPTLQVEPMYIAAAMQQYRLARVESIGIAINESQQDTEADSPSVSIR